MNKPIIQENKDALPDKLKEGIEGLSGESLDNLKVHYNSNEPAQFKSHSDTKDTSIHLAPGQEKNLPHEPWRVVQQTEGIVQPKMQLKEEVNDDKELEQEADKMGSDAIVLVSFDKQ